MRRFPTPPRAGGSTSRICIFFFLRQALQRTVGVAGGNDHLGEDLRDPARHLALTLTGRFAAITPPYAEIDRRA